MRVKITTVEPGEELDIHPSNIFHIEEYTKSKNSKVSLLPPIFETKKEKALKIWYYEVDNK